MLHTYLLPLVCSPTFRMHSQDQLPMRALPRVSWAPLHRSLLKKMSTDLPTLSVDSGALCLYLTFDIRHYVFSL